MERVIVETVFAEPITLEAIEAAIQSGQPCLVAHRVRHLRSYVSLDGLRSVCEYEAPDAESLRQVSQRLGRTYERIWTARVFSSEK